MKKYLSECETLNELNITDFSQIDSNNIRSFARIFKDVDPQVADKAISMIPDFTKIVMNALESYKHSYNRSLDMIETSSESYNLFCSEIVAILAKMSENPKNNHEDKARIINALMQLELRRASRDDDDRAAIRAEREAYNSHVENLFGVALAVVALLFGAAITSHMSGKGK